LGLAADVAGAPLAMAMPAGLFVVRKLPNTEFYSADIFSY
jgi:hypothetical protein